MSGGRRSGRTRSRGALLAALALTACATIPPRQVVDWCPAPPYGDLEPGATLRGAGGAYDLVLVATQGPETGERTEGTLELVPRDDEQNPLIGWSDIDLSEIGAYERGSVESQDSAAPGIRVFETERDAGPSILMRLGSAANDPDVRAIEGTYSVLRVQLVEDAVFRGTWESGLDDVVAAGYFCAERVEG